MKQNMRGGIDFVREQTDPSAQRQKSKVGRSPEAGRVRGKGWSLPLKYILRPLTIWREVRARPKQICAAV